MKKIVLTILAMVISFGGGFYSGWVSKKPETVTLIDTVISVPAVTRNDLPPAVITRRPHGTALPAANPGDSVPVGQATPESKTFDWHIETDSTFISGYATVGITGELEALGVDSLWVQPPVVHFRDSVNCPEIPDGSPVKDYAIITLASVVVVETIIILLLL